MELLKRRLSYVSKKSLKIALALLFFWAIILSSLVLTAQQKRALTFQDVMKFKAIKDPVISENGLWVAYSSEPDRGDGEARIQSAKEDRVLTIARGTKPVFSKDSSWLAVAIKPSAIDLEKANKEKPKQGLALLEISTGKITSFEKIERFAFSDNSLWVAYQAYKEEEKKEGKEEKEEKKEEVGSTLTLRQLTSGEEIQIPYVLAFSFDSSSKCLAYAIAEPGAKGNGLFYKELSQDGWPEKTISKDEKGSYTNLSWTKQGSKLAYLSGLLDEKGGVGQSSLWIWDLETRKAIEAVKAQALPPDWIIPSKNELSWTQDGRRLFFGLKPKDFPVDKEEGKEDSEKEVKIDLFDMDKILEKREVDVWHWNDPRIITNQKKLWPQLKDKTYRAVFHLESGRMVALADKDMPLVLPTENPRFALGLSDTPYLKEITWDGSYNDVYVVDLGDGSRKKVVARLDDQPSLSPNGGLVAYYSERQWYLYENKTGTTRNLTSKLKVTFFNDEQDTPGSPHGYGLAGWVEDDSAVLIYDKYDIWQFPTASGEPLNLTSGEGRGNSITFRVLRLDPEARFFKRNEPLLLSAYHNLEKHRGFFSSRVGSPGVEKKLEAKKLFTFLDKAKKADTIIFTRESYEEFPDIWVSDLGFSSPRKISDTNPQIKEFLWGSAELVEWRSLDGILLQGVLIKPGDFEPGKRIPVIVYFYELSSQRLYEFNQPVVNHRPCFPFYASNGYAVFLPDVRYELGRPGLSATKCLVPGVEKLIEMGVADPKRIGLHGHSWSGYQTAFVITQTNIFSCAIAGAAVSNMTSAYSGIRWESGLARQFQYEKDQSRIGGSLWEYPERYIENSPVFFADRIQTPLLLEFGDEDGAVPWYQGIELYLAMRRLGKDCIFLQYRGEPHHPQKYPNKLDYAIKMKQYFDHYLRGEPAPDWIKNGVGYRGDV